MEIQGLKYPLELKGGGLALSSDVELVAQGILSILKTRPGERVMLPRYGVRDQVFDAVRDASDVSMEIQRALDTQLQIPGVIVNVTAQANDDGLVQVTVAWSLNGIPQPPIGYELR